MEWESTAQIKIPTDPFERIIGQEDAIRIARLVGKQRRHLLLVGPPGTGKSMIAQAIASTLPKPIYQVNVVHNPSQPERPLIEILTADQIKEEAPQQQIGKVVDVNDVPVFVAEQLGLRCARCGAASPSTVAVCPVCGAQKRMGRGHEDEWSAENSADIQRVVTIRRNPNNKQEKIVYERRSDGTIVMLNEDELRKLEGLTAKKQKKILLHLNRPLFVQVSGGSETELLGDVRHDPYGGQPPLGVLPYLRVLPGAIHEAHEGVLYIDELATLGHIQKQLLTAMQEKIFPITGRNPTSSGAAVRVDGVPCDFILVGSVNIVDLHAIVPSLRSRIRGNGYEVLMEHAMEDNQKNREKMAQFVAQEIVKDGHIPHATMEAVDEIIEEGKRLAKKIDGVNGITLRLRTLAGIVKLAGDIAIADGSNLITKSHIRAAIKNSRNIEEMIEEKYGSLWGAGQADYGVGSKRPGPETA